MNDIIFVDSFSVTDDLRGKKLTYENLKERVLAAGRFSVFEATENQKRAKLFDKLCDDPELEIESVGFPWSLVRLKK